MPHSNTAKAWYNRVMLSKARQAQPEDFRHISGVSREDFNLTYILNRYHTDEYFPPFNPYKDLIIDPSWRCIASEARPPKRSFNPSPWPLTQNANA